MFTVYRVDTRVSERPFMYVAYVYALRGFLCSDFRAIVSMPHMGT